MGSSRPNLSAITNVVYRNSKNENLSGCVKVHIQETLEASQINELKCTNATI